jgi:hypothetical protein
VDGCLPPVAAGDVTVKPRSRERRPWLASANATVPYGVEGIVAVVAPDGNLNTLDGGWLEYFVNSK